MNCALVPPQNSLIPTRSGSVVGRCSSPILMVMLLSLKLASAMQMTNCSKYFSVKQLYINGETQFVGTAHVAGCMRPTPTVRVEKYEDVVDSTHRPVSFQPIYFSFLTSQFRAITKKENCTLRPHTWHAVDNPGDRLDKICLPHSWYY